jgi:aryl-alcohol dehydrogenase-like predicted oxidoreductase
MRRRKLGQTGLEVSELGLGTWGLCGDGYGPVPEAEQQRVIDRARAMGITLFETADGYAHGQMETRLGRQLANVADVHVVTKIGTDRTARIARKRFDPDYLRLSFERSREQLGQQSISVLLLHNPSAAAVQRGEATALLAELQRAGHTRAWGVSAGSTNVARAALAQGAQVVQLAYNAFHSGDLRALRDELARSPAGVLVHSVLAYGLLCGTWSVDKQFAEGDHRAERWNRDELRLRILQLDAIRPTLDKTVPTLRAAALRYALSAPQVSSVLLGPRNALQLDQLVREAGAPPYLTQDKRAALEARLRRLRTD